MKKGLRKSGLAEAQPAAPASEKKGKRKGGKKAPQTPPGKEAPAPAASEVEPALPPPPGDTITLKSGSVLDGVQILRETIDTFYIEVVEGQDPLEIARKHVDSVVYDEFDLARQRRREYSFLLLKLLFLLLLPLLAPVE